MRKLSKFWVLASVAALAACGEKAPPPVIAPPPPPPPPAPEPVPPRPLPPVGATDSVKIPAVGADGIRHTILADSSGEQLIWNFRSAFNVAALNCTAPTHLEIADHYRAFLKTHAKGLKQANAGVDAAFRKLHGAKFLRERETYMTQVYNFFAFPPTQPKFCDAALVLARESKLIAPKDLPAFAQRSFGTFGSVYEQFYRDYEAYQAKLAAWDAKYGARVTSTQ